MYAAFLVTNQGAFFDATDPSSTETALNDVTSCEPALDDVTSCEPALNDDT